MKHQLLAFRSIVIPVALILLAAISGENKAYANKPIDVFSKQKELDIEIEHAIGHKQVDRVEVLENFFKKYDSPLEANSQTFVDVADFYNIDYRLLPAISCMESTCGKHLIEGSYNPFGWGIYGNNRILFSSYDEAIKTVGAGLNKNYFSRGYDTIEKIAPIYTPPNPHNWARGVKSFSKEIATIATNL